MHFRNCLHINTILYAYFHIQHISGLLDRQRKVELLRLNEKLRHINATLKRQAKLESYAPALIYAHFTSKIPTNEVIIDPRKQELHRVFEWFFRSQKENKKT